MTKTREERQAEVDKIISQQLDDRNRQAAVDRATPTTQDRLQAIYDKDGWRAFETAYHAEPIETQVDLALFYEATLDYDIDTGEAELRRAERNFGC